ncbi:MAG: TAXI family TRAP transporter solute-binding subunit [Deltaproteobacteria bacterium]|nr:TAXI family TRAP transporter solute-binding subunit [Deltaproteobacteria bacterium]
MKEFRVPLAPWVMIIGVILCCFLAFPKVIRDAQAAERVLLKMGVTSSTSGSFVGPAAFARVVSKYAPGVEVLPLESGATYDNLYRMREGIFDMGVFFYDGVMECYNGWGIFKGKPWKDVRVIAMRTGMAIHVSIYVRKGSKIKSFADFIGTDLKLCPGIPGSGADQFLRNAIHALGVKVNIVPMAYSDAVKALRERRVDGVLKSSTSFEAFDSSMYEVHLTIPLTIVSFTEQEAKKINSVHGQYSMRYYPKGVNKEDPSAGDFWVYSPFSTYYGSNKIPEDIVYRMIKAASSNVKDLLAADSTSAKDPAGDLLKTLVEAGYAKDKIAPVHAGTVRYLKEKGLDVPDYLIPPEYKK